MAPPVQLGGSWSLFPKTEALQKGKDVGFGERFRLGRMDVKSLLGTVYTVRKIT